MGNFIMLLLRVGHLKQCPSCLELLLGNTTSINIFGEITSANLTKIAKEFNANYMKKVYQKSGGNVCYLGLLARRRDVLPDGCASLQRIVESVLNFSLDKSLQCFDWSGELSQEQNSIWSN
jgi:hypothetical protein